VACVECDPGLGSKASTCHIVSGVTNKGDGLTICDTDDINLAIAKLKNSSGNIYEVGIPAALSTAARRCTGPAHSARGLVASLRHWPLADLVALFHSCFGA